MSSYSKQSSSSFQIHIPDQKLQKSKEKNSKTQGVIKDPTNTNNSHPQPQIKGTNIINSGKENDDKIPGRYPATTTSKITTPTTKEDITKKSQVIVGKTSSISSDPKDLSVVSTSDVR